MYGPVDVQRVVSMVHRRVAETLRGHRAARGQEMDVMGGFVKRVFIIVGVVALVGLLLLLLWLVWPLILLTFLSVLLAIFWRALGWPLSRYTPLPERWAVLVAVLLFTGLTGLGAWFSAPQLAEQATQFLSTLPSALTQLSDTLAQTPVGQNLMDVLPEAEEVPEAMPSLEAVAPQVMGLFEPLFGTFAGIARVTTDLIYVFFAALFFALAPKQHRHGLVKLVPKGGRARAREVLSAMGKALRGWLLGRFVAMVAVGVMVTLGLWALGIPAALLLGVLAFLFDFIPYLGPFLAAVPALLLAFTESPTTVVWVAGLYLVVQHIESYVVTPLVQEQAIDLPPILTLVSIFLFGSLFGFLGLLVVTPLMAVTLVLIRMLYIEDALGDLPDDAPPSRPILVRRRNA